MRYPVLLSQTLSLLNIYIRYKDLLLSTIILKENGTDGTGRTGFLKKK